MAEKSKFTCFGPIRLLRAQLPNNGTTEVVNAAGLSHAEGGGLGGEVRGDGKGAAVVESFGPGVAEQRCQIGSEALGDFAADAVVVPHAVRFQELDSGRSPLRKWHALDDRSISRKRLARIQQVRQVAAFGTI